jgi:GTP-binding protein HflX
LQEAREADLILHLIDPSDPNRWQRVRQVNSVLKQLDADRVPQIRVYNKIDKLDRIPRVANNQRGEGRAVWLSAATGDGIEMLLDAIGSRVLSKTMRGVIRLQSTQGRQRAKLFEIGAVLNEEVSDDGSWTIELKMAERDLLRFLKHENLAAQLLEPLTV